MGGSVREQVARCGALVLGVVTVGAVASSARAATVTFDDILSGATLYSYDGDGDGVPDVVFSTPDPSGFNTAGPGPNMLYIDEPGIEGSSQIPESLRVDFTLGATGRLGFGFALCTTSETSGVRFVIYDSAGGVLSDTLTTATYSTMPGGGRSNFPEAMVDVAFPGVAAYATFTFTNTTAADPGSCGRYLLDTFTGTFGSSEIDVCADDGDCADGVCVDGVCFAAPDGAECARDVECASDHCVDGVCCESACGGGALDCMACAIDAGGTADGQCTPLAPAAAAAVTCRAASGVCDAAETCDPGSLACPADAFASGVSCRDASCAAGTATLAASCDGTGPECPAVSTAACAPYLCGAVACATSCADDADCAGGHYCDAGACVPLEPLGSSCARTGECGSGHCVDGVCCESACTGQCEACGLSGTCAPVVGAPQGGRAACASDGTICGGACDGATRVACAYPTADTECRAASCGSGVATSAAACDGAGACPAIATTTCAPYVCGVDACLATCAADADCTSGHYCGGGACAPHEPNGESCARDGECASGFCVDGVCCDGACTGQCEACDVAGSAGSCAAVSGPPHGGRAACASDGGVCGGSCDGARRDACAYPSVETECRAGSCADGVATLADGCDGAGACPAERTQDCGHFPCGDVVCAGDCAADEDCADGAYCSAGVCVPELDDGAACGRAEECGSGHCVDGVCCDAACDGQCEACDVEEHAGVCTPVVGDPHGGRAACASDGTGCAGSCDGTARDACSYPDAEVSCGEATCEAGTATAAGSCDGAGSCSEGVATSCGPYACGEDACLEACADHTDCASGFVCAGGACELPMSLDGGAVGPDAGVDERPTAGGCGCRAGTSRSHGGLLLLALISLVVLRRARRARGG